jgi:hypothetical protein
LFVRTYGMHAHLLTIDDEPVGSIAGLEEHRTPGGGVPVLGIIDVM